MSNHRLVLSIATVFASLAVGVIACSDDDGGSSFNDGAKDSGIPDTGSFVTDSGPDDDASTPVVCNPSLPSTFAPTWNPPTKKSACTTAQLGEYYDRCLADLDEDPDAGPDASTACQIWTAANADCATCIAPTDGTGPIEWHLGTQYDYYTINVAGCLSLERNEPDAGGCPAAYAASIQCQRASCQDCFLDENATFDDFQQCQSGAKTTGCAELNAHVGEVCGTTYNDPDGGAYDCFRQGSEDPKTHYVRVEGIFCGP